ncbi:MAG: PP2C family serine/threonine-protein phosphatase [Deltaproteobacteria bacterium]
MTNRSEAELRALGKKLAVEPEYKLLELDGFTAVRDLANIQRYGVGDLVRVPRTVGKCTLGVVSEIEQGGIVSIVVRSVATGRLSIKELDTTSLMEANPLKIGDFVYLDGSPFWVAGIDPDGEILVLGRAGRRVDPAEFLERLREIIEEDHEVTVQISPQERARMATELTPSRPLSMARPMGTSPYVPIESILRADSGYGLIAGNKETDTVYNLRSPLASAALHTNRGHNYKSWNEDGGALFADADGRLFLGVFDQAGGEGSDEHNRGAASALAAEMLFAEMQTVAEQRGGYDEAEAALVKAAQKAHVAIVARGRGEVTTFVGAMIDHEIAVIVNIGDSGAMHFSSRGKHLRSTEAQGVGRVLLEGLGMLRKRSFEHQAYRWGVQTGDYLVFGSDGLLDSRLTEAELGQVLTRAGGAAEATRALRDVVSERMKTKEGKPDNLTVLVVRVGERNV